MNVAVMSDIVRQKDDKLKEVATQLTKGTAEGFNNAFKLLDESGSIPQSDSKNKQLDPIAEISEKIGSMSDIERSATLVGVATNKQRRLVNASIRSALEKNGTLTGSAMGVKYIIRLLYD